MDKPWLAHYAPGVEAEVDVLKYNSIVELFDKYTNKYADNNAFISMHTELSYRELREKSEAFAAYLQHKMGMKKGDKFAIMTPNVLQYPILTLMLLQLSIQFDYFLPCSPAAINN